MNYSYNSALGSVLNFMLSR